MRTEPMPRLQKEPSMYLVIGLVMFMQGIFVFGAAMSRDSAQLSLMPRMMVLVTQEHCWTMDVTVPEPILIPTAAPIVSYPSSAPPAQRKDRVRKHGF